jgi:peptidylprolyl isomerase
MHHPLARPSILSALCLAVSILVAPALTRAADPIARAGSVELSAEEVRALVGSLSSREQEAVAKDPALLTQVVRAYLSRKALLAEVTAKKFDQQASVKAQLDRAREQQLLDLYLDSVSTPPAGYPGDAELQAAYDANKKALELPRQLRVAQIYVALPKSADKAIEEKAKKKLDDLAKKLKSKGADFAAIARTESEDAQTAGRGGEIGWLTEEQMVGGIRSAATALAKDAVSEPVRLDDGWHVLKLLDSRPAGPRPLADVREALVSQLRTAKGRELRQAYVAKLVEQNPPVVNELALSKVLQKAK